MSAATLILRMHGYTTPLDYSVLGFISAPAASGDAVLTFRCEHGSVSQREDDCQHTTWDDGTVRVVFDVAMLLDELETATNNCVCVQEARAYHDERRDARRARRAAKQRGE